MVCKHCGVETLKLPDPSTGAIRRGDGNLFITHYSRVNRFLKLLDAVVFPHPSKKDTPMLQYLDDQKACVENIQELMGVMQGSGLPDKGVI